jgi:ferredoxin/DMSO/TMAO reductase YedYZ heme-binding membrane subunit
VTPDQADAYAGAVVHIVAAVVGFLSYFLLWLAVVWGLMLRNGWAGTRMRHTTIYAIHMSIALFAISIGLVHAFAQLAVPKGKVSLIDEFVPFLVKQDPVGVGIATIGTELFVAATLAVGFQKKLGFTRFRAVHSLVYVAFMLIAAHALISGSDMAYPIAWGGVLLTLLIVIALWFTTTPWITKAKTGVANQMAARQQGVEAVTVNVDPVRCARFGFCEHEAPDVFKVRGDGRLEYRATVRSDQLDPVVRAVEVCPARAIVLGKAPSSVMTSRSAPPQAAPPVSPGLGPVPDRDRMGTVTGMRRNGRGGAR